MRCKIEAKEEYFGYLIFGLPTSVIDDSFTYWALVEDPINGIRLFDEQITITGPALIEGYGINNHEKYYTASRKIAFARIKARLLLDFYKVGEKYQKIIRSLSQTVENKEVVDISKWILKGLHNIKSKYPLKYKYFPFEIDGFCDLFDIKKNQFFNEIHQLVDNNLIEINSIEDGKNCFYLTNKGVDFVSSKKEKIKLLKIIDDKISFYAENVFVATFYELQNKWLANSSSPNDDKYYGRIEFSKEQFVKLTDGLSILLENLQELENKAKQIGLKKSPYNDIIFTLKQMLAYSNQKITELNKRYGERITDNLSYGTLRILKSGLLLKLINDIEFQSLTNLPKSVAESYTKEILGYYDILEKDYFKDQKPISFFYELISFKYSNISTEDLIKEPKEKSFSKSIIYLLEKGENNDCEFKGSFLLDINRLVLGDGANSNNKDVVSKGILKTIVAFLNCNGGNILVGILEKNKFPELKLKNKLDYTSYGDYFIIGINPEFKNDKDTYELNIRQAISAKISNDVVELVQLRFENYNNFTICNITVQPSFNRWYYFENMHFYIRDGNRTIELKGQDADSYKSRNPKLKL